jgi:hypothetical protein
MSDFRRDSPPGQNLTPAERYLRERADGLPGIGRPLSERARLAQRSVESYLTGANNPPRWMERAAEIDRRVKRERRLLEAERDALRARVRHDAAGSRGRGGRSPWSAGARASTAS